MDSTVLQCSWGYEGKLRYNAWLSTGIAAISDAFAVQASTNGPIMVEYSLCGYQAIDPHETGSIKLRSRFSFVGYHK
jgi:hypothetical protein